MVKRSVILVIVALTVLSLACTFTSIPARLFSTRTPAPTATATVTLTPSPSPTPTATPTPLPEARVNVVGEQLLFNGDYDQALKTFQSALNEATDPETKAGALLGIGRARYLLADYGGALDALNDVLANYPDSGHAPNAHFFRALAYQAQENNAPAAEDFSAYLQARPGPLTAYVQELRGDALSASGDYQSAIDAYQAAVDAPQLSDTIFTQVKIARSYQSMGDNNAAVRLYMKIFDITTSDYVKAQVDLLAGQVYLEMGIPEQAYARFQDAVNNYPRSYDSYSALVALVDAGQPVNDLNRGLVDYFAGQYGVAIDAFQRYLDANPEHDGTSHYYKALALRANDQNEAAVQEFDALIRDHPGDRLLVDAYLDRATTQWAYLDRYDFAAQGLLDFIKAYPQDPKAADVLFEAARIQERGGKLSEAAGTWQRVMDEYPSSASSYRSLFLAGVTRYRLKAYDQALTVFQRLLVLATGPEDQAMAYFWIGKTQKALGKADAAKAAWEQSAAADPTGYYSERARNVLKNRPILYAAQNYNLGYDLKRERSEAANWVRATFHLADDAVLGSLGALSGDARIQRGNAFWGLGLYSEARDEFEAVRIGVASDPAATFTLMNHLLDLGVYRSAILASRQVLDLANMSDAETMSAPVYFNHIRFGIYFKDRVLDAARDEGFNPLFLLSLLRQESLFESFAYSSAGARGLMQIMPATGEEIARSMNWPPDYAAGDLLRPVISIPMGARYLARQRDYFDGDLFAALAAYNGGPGNSQKWKELSGNDPDLFLEIIRYDETRKYLMQISDFLNIYNRLYTITP